MKRPPPTSGVLVGAAAFALALLTAWPSSAESPAPTSPDVEDASAPSQAPPEADDKALGLAPLDPALDVVKTPPAFTAEDAGGFLWSFVKSMMMLAAVLALIYLVLHKGLGRLVARTQMGRRMRVVERIALDQRRSLYLVEVDGHEVLLAGTDGGITAVPMPKAGAREEPATPARFSTDLGKPGRAPPTSSAFKEGEGHSGSKVQSTDLHGAKTAREREEG